MQTDTLLSFMIELPLMILGAIVFIIVLTIIITVCKFIKDKYL